MPSLQATALSVAILGGIATWLFLSVGTILIWAAFVAWACFFHSGADVAALRSTITSNVFGVFVGATTGLAIVGWGVPVALSGPIWVAMLVFFSVIIYILASRIRWFESVPGTTYGYACAFAFLTQNQGYFTVQSLTSISLENAYLVVPLSMIIGAVFGYGSSRLAATIQNSFA